MFREQQNRKLCRRKFRPGTGESIHGLEDGPVFIRDRISVYITRDRFMVYRPAARHESH